MKKQVSLVLIALLVSSVLRGSSVTSIGGGGSALTSPVGISDGGTGQTSAQAAIDALLPSQASANGKYLTSNGSASSWGSITAVSGPGSSVDGEISTWNGTGGNTLRSESKFKVTPATGIVNQTFTGSIADYLHRYDLGTATTWSTIRSLTGAIASTPSTMYMDYIDFSYDLGAAARVFAGDRFTPSFSGTTSARVQRDYTFLTASSSGTSWGGNNASATGVLAYQAVGYNTHSTGGVGAMHGMALGNKALGLRGLGAMATGTNGNAGGVTGTGSTSGTPTIAFGGYFDLDANYDSGTETEVWPNVSAALVANTGDAAATIPAFIAQNNGSSVFQVQNNGRTVIGANGGTARHELNTATQATGSATATLTNSPVAGNPTMYIKLMVNGTEVFIPAWRTP